MFSIFPNFSRKKHFPENPHSLRQMSAAKNFKNFGAPPQREAHRSQKINIPQATLLVRLVKRRIEHDI